MVDNTESTNHSNIANSSLFAALSFFVKSSEFGQPVTTDLSGKILAGEVDYANPEVQRSMAEKSTRGEVRAFEATLKSQQADGSITPSNTRVGWLSSNPANQNTVEKCAPTPSTETAASIYPVDPDKEPNDPNPNKAKP